MPTQTGIKRRDALSEGGHVLGMQYVRVVWGRDVSIIWSGPQAKPVGVIDIRDCGKRDRYVLIVDFVPRPGDPPVPGTNSRGVETVLYSM